MAVLTVRNVPDEVHRALRQRAASRGRSTEAEVRAILEEAVRPETPAAYGQRPRRNRAQGGPHRPGARRHRPIARPAPSQADEGRVTLLDTDVVSEVLKVDPNAEVRPWLSASRAVAPFRAVGLTVIHPWQASA